MAFGSPLALYSQKLPPCAFTRHIRYGDFFAELKANQDKITRVIKEEEVQFNRTIAQGLKVFDKKARALLASGVRVLPGKDAFLLSGSMGFPLDLTEIMCEARGMSVDKVGFNECIQAEKDKNAGGAKEGDKDMVFMAKETTYLTDKAIKPTEQAAKYAEGEISATVVALFTGRGGLPTEKGFVEACSGEDEVCGVVLDATSFYAQQGGQVWDTGLLTCADGSSFSVTNVQLYAGYVVHIGEV